MLQDLVICWFKKVCWCNSKPNITSAHGRTVGQIFSYHKSEEVNWSQSQLRFWPHLNIFISNLCNLNGERLQYVCFLYPSPSFLKSIDDVLPCSFKGCGGLRERGGGGRSFCVAMYCFPLLLALQYCLNPQLRSRYHCARGFSDTL